LELPLELMQYNPNQHKRLQCLGVWLSNQAVFGKIMFGCSHCVACNHLHVLVEVCRGRGG